MEPLLRASLVTLASLSLLGGVAAIARPAPDKRLERLGLLLHHGVALGTALAAAVVALLGGGDGRPLMLCAIAILLPLCLQDVVSARVAFVSLPLLAAGLGVQACVLFGVLSPAVGGGICGGIAAASSAAAAGACAMGARSLEVPRARALVASQIAALGIALLAGIMGLLPSESTSGAWAIAVGTAGAIATSGRLSPNAPPGLREIGAAFAVALLAVAAAAAASLPVDVVAHAAFWAALVSLATFALVRASVDARRPIPRVEQREAPSDLQLPSGAALAAMSPLLDDALLRRPARPRVIARVPARRLLDAALERARSAQPLRGRREDLLKVEVVAIDSDIDVDGDPADLAEALCAVLDNALRARALHPDVKVQVHLRGSAAAVTFEVSDVLPDDADPMANAGIPDADAPFLHPRTDVDRPGLGVSLARARILVERNGGKLLTRSSAEGSFVQVTMPRRMQKGAVGIA